MRNFLARLLLVLLCLGTVPAFAQSTSRVVTDCTTGVPLAYAIGSTSLTTMLADGRACVNTSGGGAVTIANGVDVAEGSTTDAPATTPTSATAATAIALQKAIANAVSGPIPGGTNVIGTVGFTSQYPAGATPITASNTGTTTATTATLAASASIKTYICGFSIRANATAAATNNSTVTGTISGTLNYTQWTAPLASGIGLTEQIFPTCIPSSAINTAIAVISGAPGSGGVVSVTAWGYQL